MIEFARFGVNKKQQVTRLLYEISKREGVSAPSIIRPEEFSDYESLKKYLLKRRYPNAFLYSRPLKPYLPKLDIDPAAKFFIKSGKFYPKDIFIEDAASDSFLAKRFKKLFTKANFHRINSLKKYLAARRGFRIEDYNRRRDAVFIVNENRDFFKKCPCTKSAQSCGYHIFNLGFGCIFECNYCFLQCYTNSPGIILPANISAFFDKFKLYKRPGMRIGTGEFSDSLALDDITRYAPEIINFFKGHKGVAFEFKTKSVNIGNVLKAAHSGNIVVSWSLNPERVIRENEYLTPSLEERLIAAGKCARAGYRTGFHFDPVIYFDGWEKQYKGLVEELFDRVKPANIPWISVGAFRFPPQLKQIIENRFPQNKILDEELLLGYDNKLRYPNNIRYNIYNKMFQTLGKYYPKSNIYLCMEEKLRP